MSATTPIFVGQFTQSEATAAQRTFSFVAVDVTVAIVRHVAPLSSEYSRVFLGVMPVPVQRIW